MIVDKIETSPNHFGPDIPQGLEYKSAQLNVDGQTYTITFTQEQEKALNVPIAKAKLQLHRMGLLNAVEGAIASSQDVELQLYWAEVHFLERYSPAVIAIGQALNIDLDQFFKDANAIKK